jgi:ABC-type transport system involved in multi-copper enzyme maturation permease subunit
MTAQLRSELLKWRTTRTLILLLLFAIGLTLLVACGEVLSHNAHKLAQEDYQRTIFSTAGGVVVLFATLAGLISVTTEFRYGTIRPTLLFEPRRRVFLAAKLAAAALAAGLVAVGCLLASWGGGLLLLSARNVDIVLTSAHGITIVLGTIAASALGAMLGVAIGALIRNQVGAVVAVAAYAFIVDASLFSAVPSVGRYLPGKASDAMAGLPTAHLVTPAVGVAVYSTWTLAFLIAAAIRTERTDV